MFTEGIIAGRVATIFLRIYYVPGSAMSSLYRYFIKSLPQVGTINLSSQKVTHPKSCPSDRGKIQTQNGNHSVLLPASGILKDFSINVTQQTQDLGAWVLGPILLLNC